MTSIFSHAGDRDDRPTAGVYWFAGDPRWEPPKDVTPLTTTIEADVCIVGGGFTGLWSALHIKKLSRDTEVVLLEREFCGSGAAGRNGGWVNGFEHDLPNFIGRFGEESAVWLVDASKRSMDEMTETVREGGIDCDLALIGGLTVATCEAHLSYWADMVPAARRVGREDLFRVLSAEEAREVSGCPQATGALEIQHAGSVQPALLARGLRQLAIEAGVRIFEMSPMTRFGRTRPAVVETTAGCVVADRVVLATASWLASITELQRTLFIIPANVVATAPCPEQLDRIGWVKGRPFADARITVHYGQRTADDRMVFGRGGGRLGFGGRVIPAHFHDEREAREIVADMGELMPAMRGVGIDWRWGGPVDRAQHGFPWIGTLGRQRNIHYGAGYSGNGVGPSHFVGRTLAALALGLQDDYATSPLVSEPPSYLPMEPVRFVGARLVRSAIKRCEDAEAAGKQPDPVSRQLRKALGVSLPKGVEVWRFAR
jgi:glycine/D-amino acid oxidase-like deaminating enzyme